MICEGHIHDENHCFAKLRTTQQQVCTGDRFRGFRRHRARAHDRLNTLEKDVAELKEMISQLSQQRNEPQEYNYYSDEQQQEDDEAAYEEVVEESREIPVQEVVVDEPEVVVDDEPLQVELDQDEDAEKTAALNFLREMGIEIDQGVEFLLAENDNDVDTVLSMLL